MCLADTQKVLIEWQLVLIKLKVQLNWHVAKHQNSNFKKINFIFKFTYLNIII